MKTEGGREMMDVIRTVAVWIVGIELIITAGFGVLVLWDKIRRREKR